MSDPGWAPTFLTSVGLWILMAMAMMLPTALPAARSISLNGKWKRRQRGPALFAVGYLAVWSAVGRPPAVRGLVDRAESYWPIGYFRGIGRSRRHGSRRAGSDCVCVPVIACGRCLPMGGELTEHLSARESAMGLGARARVV